MGLEGQTAGLRHWEWDSYEKAERASKNKHGDLGRLRSYLQYPSTSPNQQLFSFAQPREWCSLTRELGRVQVYFLCLRPSLFPTTHPSRKLNHNPSHCCVTPGPHLRRDNCTPKFIAALLRNKLRHGNNLSVHHRING